MSMLAPPFQLLEINVISAQDLATVAKSMKAYAVAWIHPDRKLTTQIDPDGDNNPTWNEKLVFRVDEDFLTADDSVIMIEIYASAWLRDVLIGTIAVHVNSLLPPAARSTGRKSSKLRFVALQVRRPSGRPQGILNFGVNLADATMRSMPTYSEISASAVGNPKKDESVVVAYDPKLVTLQRSQSEKSGSTLSDYAYNPAKLSGYYADAADSELGLPPPATKNGKIVNANGSLCSDVGPSPSVVAAAIAKGLYPVPLPAPRTPANPIFQDWPGKDSEVDVPAKVVERWRSHTVAPVYDHHQGHADRKGKGKGKGGRGRGGNGLFSCFGTAMGCEFSITCGGGGGHGKKKGDGRKGHVGAASELTYTYDESYVSLRN